jgi:hypothetical protein
MTLDRALDTDPAQILPGLVGRGTDAGSPRSESQPWNCIVVNYNFAAANADRPWTPLHVPAG